MVPFGQQRPQQEAQIRALARSRRQKDAQLRKLALQVQELQKAQQMATRFPGAQVGGVSNLDKVATYEASPKNPAGAQ